MILPSDIPAVIIERAKKYREQIKSEWGSWCDGDKTNEGHFQGMDVQSMLVDGIEVRLCTACIKAIQIDQNVKVGSEESPTKMFTVTFPDKSEKYVENVYTYWIDAEVKILYLSNSNGEIIAAFNEWWSFTIR